MHTLANPSLAILNTALSLLASPDRAFGGLHRHQQFNLTDDGHIGIDLGGSLGRRCLDVGGAAVGTPLTPLGALASNGAARARTPGRQQESPDDDPDAAAALMLEAGAERESELVVLVVLAPCNASSESQKWEYKSIMGTYKR